MLLTENEEKGKDVVHQFKGKRKEERFRSLLQTKSRYRNVMIHLDRHHTVYKYIPYMKETYFMLSK